MNRLSSPRRRIAPTTNVQPPSPINTADPTPTQTPSPAPPVNAGLSIGRRRLSFTSPPQQQQVIDDFAGDQNTRGVLQVGGIVNGRIETQTDSDWIRIVLEAGRTYQFDAAGIDLRDPALFLRDSFGREIAFNDDVNFPANLNSRIVARPTVTGSYFIDIRSFKGNTGSYSITAREIAANISPRATRFDIDLNYTGDSIYQPFFTEAARRWSDIITTDIPDVNGIDDLVIDIRIVDIDGPGEVVGQAGPRQVRSGSLLPLTGFIELDRSDVENIRLNGNLWDLVLHEMGHVLGIGTLWDLKGLRSGSSYRGSNAIREYNSYGGSSGFVPLEVNGGEGTALSHWSEDLFVDELMTGFLSRRANPLSRITIGSLEDLGYGVDYGKSDSYVFSAQVSTPAPPSPVQQFTGRRYRRSLTGLSRAAKSDALIDSNSGCYCATCSNAAILGNDISRLSQVIVEKEIPPFSNFEPLSAVVQQPMANLYSFQAAEENNSYSFMPNSQDLQKPQQAIV